MDANSASVINQIDASQTDRIYTDSVNLSGDAIIHFVSQLCAVSREELCLPQPRIFSLQKVVEIAYYNMNRVRAVWKKVQWEGTCGTC
jgi:brefeldin A-inhibited guanine nucleotide-exchange protein